MKLLRILADENIPGLDELLGIYSSAGNWQYQLTRKSGREIEPEDLKGIDALLVRSVTKVDQSLLRHDSEESYSDQLRFVGTCTIGVDHIDQDLLQARGIHFVSAPGCNADAVVDYVFAASINYAGGLSTLKSKTFAVLGYGQVGSRLCYRLNQIGINTKVFDPFVKAVSEQAFIKQCESYEELLDADILSIHTPLTKAEQSNYPTYQLFQTDYLNLLKTGALLINAARGPIIDNSALLQSIKDQNIHAVLDVYEDEPEPKFELLDALYITTGHIGGYSEQGKLRGTQMVVDSLMDFLNQHSNVENADLLKPTAVRFSMKNLDTPDYSQLSSDEQVQRVVDYFYPILTESKDFIRSYQVKNAQTAQQRFDAYRKNYIVRKEWQFVNLLDTQGLLDSAKESLIALGFHIEESH